MTKPKSLAAAVREGKHSACMTRDGTPGRYEVRLRGGKLWLSTNYRMAHGFVLRRRLSETLKAFDPKLTERQINAAVDYAYYTTGARALNKALGAALAHVDAMRAQ